MPTLRPPVRGSRVITAGRVMNGPASPGHAVWIGRRPRSTSSPRSTISWLAPCRDDLRTGVCDRLQRLQPAHLRREPLGRLHLEHVREPGRDVVEALDAEGEAHAALGPELVDQQGMLRALRALEQQRRPVGAHRPIDDLGHLEVRVDLGRDADELALALEQRDPVAQVERDAHVP